jgi:hypothetical protein
VRLFRPGSPGGSLRSNNKRLGDYTKWPRVFIRHTKSSSIMIEASDRDAVGYLIVLGLVTGVTSNHWAMPCSVTCDAVLDRPRNGERRTLILWIGGILALAHGNVASIHLVLVSHRVMQQKESRLSAQSLVFSMLSLETHYAVCVDLMCASQH